jgi:outer membrane immunogenic protein
MKTITLAAAAFAAAALLPFVAQAQTTPDTTQATASDPSQTPSAGSTTGESTTANGVPIKTGGAPDGTRAFGIEPYLGVMGGYESFDSDNVGPLTNNCTGRGCPHGALVEGVGGINIPLGPLFVGAEGSIAKGFNSLDYEYGAFGRIGFRAGDSGMIYGKGGREWVHTDNKGHDDDWEWGMGVEVGPKTIGLGGLTGNSGVRLRFEATTYNLHSIRPTGGVVFHF